MNTPNNKRRRQSQQRMESAFIKLLQNTGLNKISVTDICAMAEVNRTTFYSNYEDIYGLAEAVEKRLEEEVMALYQDEWNKQESSHDFLRLFQHIKDNQLFYKTYFKLRPDGNLKIIGYDAKEALRYYDMQYIDYHIEFFGHGLNAVIKKWLDNGCVESPEVMCGIIVDEYTNRKAAL